MNKFVEKMFEKNEESIKLYDKNIVRGNSPFIGVRIPEIRKFAKEIIKNKKVSEFFLEYEGIYFEEKLIKGFIIASNEDYFNKYSLDYIKEFDSWCLVDTFCNSSKFIEKNKGKYFSFIKNLINSNEEFVIRCGYVMMLYYYLSDEYIDEVINLCLMSSEHYYVNMAISWLISEAFIKYPVRIEKLLNSKKLSEFIQNKSIDKINDSYRVSNDIKVRLRDLKYF